MHHARWLFVVLSACNVEAVQGDTGGVPRGDGGACPDGVAVVLSDYRSTQVALSTTEGTTQSESFVSTASVRSDGLSFALSGDVVLPNERPPSGRVVLIDRFGTNVVSFFEPTDGRVLGQLAVGTGFHSNPQDYIEVGAGRAYVSRYGNNELRGREPFDQGSDLLIIDTLVPEILDRIALPSSDEFPARPTGLTRLDARLVVVTLARLGREWAEGEDSTLAAIDTTRDAIVWEVELTGLKNCGTARLAPDSERLVVACSGLITEDGASLGVEGSGVVVLDARETPAVEIRRYTALELAGDPVQSELAFFAADSLLLKTQTALGSAERNRLLSLDLASGEVRTVFTVSAADNRSSGVTLGGIVCAPGCSDYCLVADAAAGALQRFRIGKDGAIEHTDTLPVERRVGLPPVGLSYR
jgi:hypothetical protein